MPGDRQRALRRAVVGDRAADHLVLGGLAGELEVVLGELPRGLDGLAATAGEEHAVEVAGGVAGDPLGQLHGLRVGVGPQRHERELGGLLGRRLGDVGASVAELVDEQAGQAVQVPLALGVVDVGALTPHDHGHLALLVDGMAGEVQPQVVAAGCLQAGEVLVGVGGGHVARHRYRCPREVVVAGAGADESPAPSCRSWRQRGKRIRRIRHLFRHEIRSVRATRPAGRNSAMTRYGAQFGPDITFLGVDRVDLDDADALAAADVVIVGAPFDGGTSNRPGTRFGPMAIRQTDYLPQDGSRPHMALRVDALQDIRGRRRRRRRDAARRDRARARGAGGGRVRRGVGRRHPAGARRRPLDRAAGRHRRRPAPRLRPGLDDPLRRPRRHRRHRVRLALRARPADAPADRVRRAARRPVPADGAARLLAGPRDPRLDGRAEHAVLRDDRDRQARARRRASTRRSRSPSTSATRSSCRSTSTSATPATRPAPAPPSPAG